MCSELNEGEKQTQLQNLTERVWPALTGTHSSWGKELATQISLSGRSGWGALGRLFGAPERQSHETDQALGVYWGEEDSP